jgi:hypothetical protein
MAEHVACMGDESNGYRILVKKSEGKRLFSRPNCKWKDIEDFREIGLGGVDWIFLSSWWLLKDLAPWS